MSLSVNGQTHKSHYDNVPKVNGIEKVRGSTPLISTKNMHFTFKLGEMFFYPSQLSHSLTLNSLTPNSHPLPADMVKYAILIRRDNEGFRL